MRRGTSRVSASRARSHANALSPITFGVVPSVAASACIRSMVSAWIGVVKVRPGAGDGASPGRSVGRSSGVAPASRSGRRANATILAAFWTRSEQTAHAFHCASLRKGAPDAAIRQRRDGAWPCPRGMTGAVPLIGPMRPWHRGRSWRSVPPLKGIPMLPAARSANPAAPNSKAGLPVPASPAAPQRGGFVARQPRSPAVLRLCKPATPMRRPRPQPSPPLTSAVILAARTGK